MKKHIFATFTAISIASISHANTNLDLQSINEKLAKLEKLEKLLTDNPALVNLLNENNSNPTALNNLIEANAQKALDKYVKTELNTSSPIVQNAINAAVSNPEVIKKVISNPEVLSQVLNKDEIIKGLASNNEFIKGFNSEQSALINSASRLQEEKLADLQNKFQSFSGLEQNAQSSLTLTAVQGLAPVAFKAMGMDPKALDEAQKHVDRHLYFATTAGYQWSPTASKKRQQESYDFSQKDNMTSTFALGIYFSGDKKKTDEVHVQALKDLKEIVGDSIDTASTYDVQLKNAIDTINKKLETENNQGNEANVKALNQKLTEIKNLNDKVFYEVSVAYKRGYAVQGEYSEIRAKTSSKFEDLSDRVSSQKHLAIVGLLPIPVLSEYAYTEHNTHIYGIAGAGYTTIKGDSAEVNNDVKTGTFEDVSGIVGIGYSRGLTEKTQIIGEARAVYSVQDNYWQTQLMAGIRVGLGQILSKYVP